MTAEAHRGAVQRIACLFCELIVRLRAVGLADRDSCVMPFTQIELADAIGVSAVHANRTIQDLRATGLIALDANTLTIKDWPGLKAFCGFDARYLHLVDDSHAA